MDHLDHQELKQSEANNTKEKKLKVLQITFITLAILGLALGAQAEALVAPGMQCTDTIINMPAGAFMGGFDILPDGNFVVNDGTAIRVISPDGTEQQALYTFGKPVYGSFVRYANNKVYFGESSTGAIMSTSLGDGLTSHITNLAGNFDLDFWNGGAYAVAGSSIYLLDEVNHEASVVAAVDGYSGPLAFDGMGNLYYSPSYYPNATCIMQWTAEQVAGVGSNGPLGLSDAATLAGLSGSYGFTFDEAGNLLVTNNAESNIKLFNGSVSTFASFNSELGQFPFLTFMRYNPTNGAIYTALSYYDADWNSTTVISALTPAPIVPEPSSIMALCSLIGLAASARLLRLRGK